jgi:hypothetical protein
MPGVIENNQWLIEERLFTFNRADIVFDPVLLNIAVIPFKTRTL